MSSYNVQRPFIIHADATVEADSMEEAKKAALAGEHSDWKYDYDTAIDMPDEEITITAPDGTQDWVLQGEERDRAPATQGD